MKQFLKYLGLAFCVAMMSSCDDKIESLMQFNIGPEIEYWSDNVEQWQSISDSLVIGEAKVWTPSNNLNYSVLLRATDPNLNFGQMSVNALTEDLDFFINETRYTNDATLSEDMFALAVRNNEPTIKIFQVITEDTWGEQSKASFEVTFKENIKPTAVLNIEQVDVITNNEYVLDASGSFDGDEDLGGAIIEYEFTINKVVVTIPKPIINHVFDSGRPGGSGKKHSVRLRCKDNDGVWSEYVEEIVIVASNSLQD